LYNVLINIKKVSSTSVLKWNENGYHFNSSEIKNSPTCSFCKNDIESMKHLFIELPLVEEILDDIEEWLLSKQI
jgi:hypothetical protein